MTKTALVPVGKKAKVKSKTLWINGITLAAGLLSLAVGGEFLADKPTFLAIIVAINGALNIGLRFLTTQPIK